MATETGDLNAAHLYTELIHKGYLDGINDVVDFRGLPFVNLATVDEMVAGIAPGTTMTVRVKQPAPAWTAADAEGPRSAEVTPEWLYVDVTVADYDITTSATDELRRREDTGSYDMDALTEWLIGGYRRLFGSLVCALAGEYTLTEGVDEDPLTWLTCKRAAAKAVNAAGQAPLGGLFAVLHPEQWDSVAEDIVASGGQIAYRADLVVTQEARQAGYRGSFDGIDFWTSPQVAEGTDGYVGMVTFYGSIWYAEAVQAPPTASMIEIFRAANVLVEEGRDFTNKATKLGATATVGVGIIHDVGCQILGAGPA